MARLAQEGSPLSVLLATTTLLSSGSQGPRTWDKALRALAAADPFFSGATVSLCRLDLEEQVREVVASCGPQAHGLTRSGLSLAGVRGPAARLLSRLREGKPLVIHNGRPLPQGSSELLERLLPCSPARSYVILPLLSNGKINGIFWIEGYDPGRYSRERTQALRLLGNCLALALATSGPPDWEEASHSILKAALEAQEKERERIALEVHDGALQNLAAAFQHVQAAMGSRRQDGEAARSSLGKASGLLQEAMNELRGLAGGPPPAILDNLGLMAAIESDVEELRQEGWQAELVADPIKMPPARETNLYRIVHEAMTNVRKHAGICPLRVSLKRGLWLWVEVRDWGRGFDAAALAQQGMPPGFGLLSMRKRAALMGASLEVESRPGAGTRVSLDVPLRRKGD